MARVIRLIDLAHAIAHAGAVPVRDGAAVTSIDLEVRVLAAGVPRADVIWGMRLRYPDPPLVGVFARWRRTRRRRAGIDVARIVLRWTPPHLDAVVDGRFIARLDFNPERTADESAAETSR